MKSLWILSARQRGFLCLFVCFVVKNLCNLCFLWFLNHCFFVFIRVHSWLKICVFHVVLRSSHSSTQWQTTAEPPEPFASFVINILFHHEILREIVGPAARHFVCVVCFVVKICIICVICGLIKFRVHSCPFVVLYLFLTQRNPYVS